MNAKDKGPDKQSEQILQIMRAEYTRLDDALDIKINPAALADHTRAMLDPRRVTPALIEYCAVMELRQMARTICRDKSPTETVNFQAELFDGQLQKRYPAMRDGEEVYVLRGHLTYKERTIIERRMNKSAVSLARHVDAFRAETEMLKQQGAFDDDEAA